MVTRKSTKRFESTEIQGEGSYVILKRVKVGEYRELKQRNPDEEDQESIMDVGLKLIESHLMDWNWVDDEGNKLPLPADDPSVIDDLYDEEATFLAESLLGDQKN